MQFIKNSLVFAFILMISLSALIIMPNESSANEVISEDPIALENVLHEQNQVISPAFVNPYRYSKENVSFTESWSGYRRVSDNSTLGKGGGDITSTKTTTFKTDISGTVLGININSGVSITSTINHRMVGEPNTVVYMGYRVKYKVETGTHVTTDVVTGKKTKKSYTVKTPLFGDYKLLKY